MSDQNQNFRVIKRRNHQNNAPVLILLHGRGASGNDIFSLTNYLKVDNFNLVAPEANSATWYPYSFMAPQSQNEPYLSEALSMLENLVSELESSGTPSEKIFFLGFSQGACLTLEFVTRNARKWAGIIAFTGGLIGETLSKENYKGDFLSTPVFIGTSDPDPHVPVFRVEETARILTEMNASLTLKIYKNLGHTISQDELEEANLLLTMS